MSNLLIRLYNVVIYNFFLINSGDNVMKAVNSETAFTPVSGSVSPSTTSITWKHRDNAGVVVKVIEWDREDDNIEIPNPKFRSHASLDKHNGELTLRYLQLQHTGMYTLDINSKEQRKQFTLTVIGESKYWHISFSSS